MRTAALVLLVLLATFAPASPAPEEYSINLHVTGTYIVSGHDYRQLELDAVIIAVQVQADNGVVMWSASVTMLLVLLATFAPA